GVYLAYSQQGGTNVDGAWNEYLMIKEHEQLVFKSNADLYGYEYDWSPDDLILAWWPGWKYSKGTDGTVINLMQFPTGETDYIPIDPDFYWGGEWLPGGFLLEWGDDGLIAIISLDCTFSPFSCQITQSRTYKFAHPYDNWENTISLSIDGKYLAYSSFDATYTSRIWILNLETEEETLMLKNR
ncbi:MAG: hypothetical protein AB1750_10080, partial [Chloroflexota bacterium]